jgi:pimeloyl-ACP methyl ester carboxylesterase
MAQRTTVATAVLLALTLCAGVAYAACPECDLDVCALVAYHGYPCETHSVTTADGFTLTMQRIPYSPHNSTRTGRPAVILQHGLLDSAATWIINLPDQSLGYLLADAGFDVWLGNNRGNFYSQPPSKADFQDLTWDDMARYDVPAFVRYVTQTAGVGSVGYVGHSEGTTQMFASYTVTAELGRLVNRFVALAPVSYVYHQTSPVFTLLVKLGVDQWFLDAGIWEFGAGPSATTELIAQLFCAPEDMTEPYCVDLILAICGNDPEPSHNLNKTRMEVYISHTPAGTSSRNMAHYAQLSTDALSLPHCTLHGCRCRRVS